MTNFGQSQKDQAGNTLRAVESIRLRHQQRRGNNLSMGLTAHTRNAKREPWAILEMPDSRARMWGPNTRIPDAGTMLLNLPSKGGFNRRAKSEVPANVDRRGQAPRGAATFLSIWLMRLGLVGRVTRPATRRTAVKLGGGSNLRSLTATGNMTRYERFGVTPKAIRFPLDRMADLLEAIC